MEAKGRIFGIRADWKAIALCLLSASVFWFFNAMNDDHTADVTYPVEFVYNENKRIPVEALPRNIKFNASGFGWNLLRKTIKVNRPPLIVNLDDLSSYKFLTANDLLPILKAQLDDVKINYVLQDTIYFKFDKLTKKKFPFKIDPLQISLVDGYKLSSPIYLDPPRITIIGPSSVLNSIKDSFYIKIPERGIQSDYEEEIPLDYELPETVKFEPEKVKVKFSVTQFSEEILELEPTLKNFPEGKTIDLEGNKIKLKVIIKPEDIDKLKNEDFTIFINYRKRIDDKNTFPVTLMKKPEYVIEYSISPSEVNLNDE